MADPITEAEATGLVERLRAATDELERAERAVESEGEAAIRRVDDVYGSFLRLIDENDGTATGSGRDAFEAYVAFQDELVSRIERLPDDLLAREAFERVGEILDKRRLSPDDMERARRALDPAAELAALLDDRRAARRRYRRARNAVERRRRAIESTIADLEQLLEYADVDLETDLDPLRGPVTAYNEAVREAFRSFCQDAPARAVLDLLDTADDYPLVDLEPAPDQLAGYLRSHPAGEEPIPRLVELADYSPSKLAHYVDDPSRFRATVAANRTYLDRLAVDPLTVAWPPPPAAELRFLARELIAVVDRFADESTVARINELRRLARTPTYDRLRRSAVARARLSSDERERVRSGAVEGEIEALRAARDRLDAALETHPDR